MNTMHWIPVSNMKMPPSLKSDVDRQTDRQTGKLTTVTLSRMHAVISNGQFSFASILVVSSSHNSTLDVMCRNEVVQNSTSNRVAPLIQTINIRKHNDSVYLHYILTEDIISSFRGSKLAPNM